MYEFKYKDLQFSHDGLDSQLTYDRYAVSTHNPDEIKVGDTVVVLIDKKKDIRRVGEVTDKTDTTFTVLTRQGDTHTVEYEMVSKPLELTPQELWTRWAKAAASVESELMQPITEDRFRLLLDGYGYSPGGRIQLGLGQEYVTGVKAALTLYNCLSGDTIVQTAQGPKRIDELVGQTVNVLSQGGVYRQAHFDEYGHQVLFEVKLANGEVLYATAGHEWLICKNGEFIKVTTSELEGKNIPIVTHRLPFDNNEVEEGIRHGIVYGDGTITQGNGDKKYGHLLLFGEKKSLQRFFQSYHIKPHHQDRYVGIYGINPQWKQVPDENASPSYWYGFVIGLIATDGHADRRGSVMLHSSNLDDLIAISKNLYKTGIAFMSIAQSRELNPYNGAYSPTYKLQFVKQTIFADDLLRQSHRDNFLSSPDSSKKTPTIKVVSVKDANRYEKVYCCNEPQTHSFVVGTGYLTGNCFVIKSPRAGDHPIDQWMKVLDAAQDEMNIQRRGGGVGTNLSDINTVKGAGDVRIALVLPMEHNDSDEYDEKISIGKFDHVEHEEIDDVETDYFKVEDSIDGLVVAIREMVHHAYFAPDKPLVLDFANVRHRGAYVRGTNGRSSGAVAWMELFNLIVSLLKQDEIDAVDFAEIYSGVTNLIEQGGSRRGALMLILNDERHDILRKFITRKQTSGKLTGANISVAISDDFMDRRAASGQFENEIWDLICESAWRSAEPGVVFLARCNKESNSWYFSELVATNPLANVAVGM